MKKRIKSAKKNNGFTLIELMVVITIILIMLGFLIPKLYGYQQKAKQTKAINTAKQIQTAAMASYSDCNQEFDTTDVKNTIGELTGVDNTSTIVAAAGTIHQNVNVTFKSDSAIYVVGVDAQSSNFTVTDIVSKAVIFPKTPAVTAIVP